MSKLDDILAEAIRSSTYGDARNIKKSSASRGGGLGATRGGINRGVPGYPVPPEMSGTDSTPSQDMEEDVNFVSFVRKLSGDQIDDAIHQKVESIVKAVASSLYEAKKLDTIGVTIGTFQPFNMSHGELVRKMANQFSKVIVLVAGNEITKDSPFLYETRTEIIKRSLPDVMSKVEIHEAESGGQKTSNIVDVVSNIIGSGDTSMKEDSAFTIVVGDDRAQDVQQQLDRARSEAADESSAVLMKESGYSDDGGKVKSSALRSALESGDDESAKKMLDPHLASNASESKRLIDTMKQEMKKFVAPKQDVVGEAISRTINEVLEDAGGIAEVRKLTQMNRNALAMRGVEIDMLSEIGQGLDGIAYLMIKKRAIFKVTTDKDEAISSLKAQTHVAGQHIVKIYDTFKFSRLPQKMKGKDIYGIVEEKLDNLPSSDMQELKELDRLIIDLMMYKKKSKDDEQKMIPSIEIPMIKGNFEGMMSAIQAVANNQEDRHPELKVPPASHADKKHRGGRSELDFDVGRSHTIPSHATMQSPKWTHAKTVRDESIDPMIDDDPQSKVKTIEDPDARKAVKRKVNPSVDRLGQLFKKFEVDKMMRELSTIGVGYSEYHSGNIRRRGKMYVVVDLGKSYTHGPEPKLLPKNQKDEMIEEPHQRVSAVHIADAIIRELAGSTSAQFTQPGGACSGRSGQSSGMIAGVGAVKDEDDIPTCVPPDESEWQANLSKVMKNVDGRDRVKQKELSGD